MTQQCLDAGIGKEEKYTTIYSAIEQDGYINQPDEDERLKFRNKYGIPGDAVVLVTVARLFELKGHDYIIESAKTLAKKFDKAVWLFVGDGNLADFYKNQIKELGLEKRIRFTGLLDPKQVPLAIHCSDIMVHCSLREGLPRVFPQAMLCSKPVIAFDVDGAKEVVNENTGRLIEPKNIEALIEACSELIENEDLRNRLGRNGQDFVKVKFHPDTMVDQTEAIYKKLIQEDEK
jgi:glycosyltransferase involved in cell wall biosynthesis